VTYSYTDSSGSSTGRQHQRFLLGLFLLIMFVVVLAHGPQQRTRRSLYRPSPRWGGEENGKKMAKTSWVRIRAV